MSAVLSPSTPSRIPASLTSFIGREREVAEVCELLATGRLVTLTGAGGSGKTRLAAEVMRVTADRFRDGATWIELAPITEPELVLGHVAASLGIGGTGRPPADALRDALRDTDRLIVLDNCEHLIVACAEAADHLLRHCPGVRILTTSREALSIPGERAWLVPLLGVPDATATVDDISRAESVRLFVDRARAANASFSLTDANARVVAQLCERLDGLPLAIELAAARIRALTPDAMMGRLGSGLRLLTSERRGVPARHRTLRDTIDWSYELLDPDERSVLQRLSVFADRFSLDAAEAVCAGDGIEPAAVLDMLASLVDKSLVMVEDRLDEARYHLLETIRQYGRERLDESAESRAVLSRHADYYYALVRAAEPHLITPARAAWVDRIQRELDDVRLVLAWTRAHESARHVEIVGRLGWFWYSSGLWTEGRRWLEEALALSDPKVPNAPRAAVLFGAGVIASLQGQGATARAWLDESSAIARALGDRSLAAYSDSYIGVALGQEGLMAAEAPARAALTWFEEVGDLYGQRLALLVLATLLMRQGDLATARAVGDDAVRVARAYGLGREIGIALQVLATVQLQQRDLDAAAASIAEALTALRLDPQPFWMARALELMGIVECARARGVHAARLFGAAERRRERMGAGLFQLDRERLAPIIAAARAAVGGERFDAAWAVGRAESFDHVVDSAIDSVLRPGIPPTASGIIGTVGTEASYTGLASKAALQVRLLGQLDIMVDGKEIPRSAWKFSRPRELLVYLLCHRDGRSREQISVALWPEASAAQAKNNVHVAMHHLRRVLGRSDFVLYQRERYVVNWSLGVEVDVLEFERDLEAARDALRANPAGPEAAARVRAALALYHGEFLEGEDAGDWHLEERDRLRRLWTEGMATLGAQLTAEGSHAEAVDVYRQLVRADEWDEAAHRHLMSALARSGQRGEALRHYDHVTALFQRDLGSVPARETVALYDRLRRGSLGS
ncbi:MAG TPA: BTAD domain-containing putative transcriptional regulator [Gemmatimonadaceae bacterium]|nr:BTAD domain-containing putative transcriptional regulator [Gemmatimonadaceae bacterium]